MPIVFNNATTARQNSGTTLAFTHTFPGTNDQVLVVCLSYRAHTNPTAQASSVVALSSLTKIRRDAAADRVTEIWLAAMSNGLSGTGTITVTFSADPEDVVATALSYEGVRITGLEIGKSAGATGATGTETLPVSVEVSSQVVVAVLAYYPNGGANNPALALPATERSALTTVANNIGGKTAELARMASAGTNNIVWSGAAFSWAASAVLLHSAGAGYKIAVDWDNDTDFLDTYEDITADVFQVDTDRGRDWDSQIFGRSSAGTLQVKLDNHTGKYSPFNTLSPLAGMLIPGMAVRVSAFYAGGEFALWTGWVDSILPDAGGAIPVATLKASGAFARLHSRAVNPLPQDNVTTGYVVDRILDDAGWPAASVGNTVPNGGFESGATAPGTFWTLFQSNMSSYAAGFSGAHTEGARSLGVQGTPSATNASVGVFQNIGGQFPPGARARLTFDVWTNTVEASPPRWLIVALVRGFDSAFAYLGDALVYQFYWPAPSAPPNHIHVDQVTGPMPEGTANVYLYLYAAMVGTVVGGEVMNCNFDNVTLTPAHVITPGRSVSTGAVQVGRWAVSQKPAFEALQEMEETEIGFLLEGRWGDVVFQDRFWRNTYHPTASLNLSDDPTARDNSYVDVKEEDPLADLYNRIEATVQAGHLGSAGTVLWTLRDVPVTIAAGASFKWIAEVAGGNLYANPWIVPVVGTDILQTGVANTDIVVSVVIAAKRMAVTVKNNHATATATLSLVQARGTPMIDDGQTQVSNSDYTSVSKYGRRDFPLRSAYYYNANYAQAACDYFLSVFKDPKPVISVAIEATTDYLLSHAIQRDVSERLAFVARAARTMLGIAGDFYIERIQHHLEPHAPLRTVWHIAPAPAAVSYWVMDVSHLGTDTTLGF